MRSPSRPGWPRAARRSTCARWGAHRGAISCGGSHPPASRDSSTASSRWSGRTTRGATSRARGGQAGPWADVERAGEWLLDAAEALSPDVVHLNGYAHGALPWDVPVVVVGHSCVLSWHEAVRGGSAGGHVGAYRDAVTLGIRGADALVAPTAAMLANLNRL